MLPTGAIAFKVAYYQSTKQIYCYPCGRFFGKHQPSTSCRPSILLFAASSESDCEHNIITDDYLLARGQDDGAAATIRSSIIGEAVGTKLKRAAIFKRRRSSLPRTTITNRNNIKQHVTNLISRLVRESCFVTTFLLLLHRVVLKTTTPTPTSYPTLFKFLTINLTRWVATSLCVKLLTLHSQITALVDQSTPLVNDANIDEDWFLKGEYHVKIEGDTSCDDYLFSSNTTLYNNTEVAAVSSLVGIRQVPRDGSCLFHAIGARLLHDKWVHKSTECNHHPQRQHYPPMTSIIEYSSKLRQQAVNALQDNPQRQFTMIQGEEEEEPISASSLVQLAAEPYGLSSDEYLTSMRDESVWGGGPEIMALASELQRQVVVLEPDEKMDDDVCFLKVRARFGESIFDIGSNTVYILCANQQFPERCGRGRYDDCNHFLAVFPFRSL
mmetsp:Transcript_23216/g.46319  ORF Transcript_23216/g.46319 Transcript_23216/m.46319 type:complete len:440 (+) Transcript_23216:285-1604(+)